MYPSVETSIDKIFAGDIAVTKGLKVPETDDVPLENGGKLIDATYLYADLAGSGRIANSLTKEAAAKVIKSYVNTSTRILRHNGGEIRSFDGDRVMAIFMGLDKEDRAVRAAMSINWAVEKVIPEAIKKHYTDPEVFPPIAHGVGIDSGEALIIRGGIRNNNDLISIGAAPNVAAKLSDIRSPSKALFITDTVKEALSEEFLAFEGQSIWSVADWNYDVGGNHVRVWGSGAWWSV
ncbi:adenylate/guanylate cyclase domain-containing protein [Agrococcus jenensis]|uniref:Class 3 adenylate cyclase n=1 Tax=Agrococcus jenensis TaxID=46353 RepID=A0A3N2APJ1_9MICO|nr:adenylate/guanylate cyclase domain-containing protein [Agrococcus jenensis]ROR64828.1 class 3 adenylate cyclase [Agrococcus jenensis]